MSTNIYSQGIFIIIFHSNTLQLLVHLHQAVATYIFEKPQPQPYQIGVRDVVGDEFWCDNV